jgi:hypothetical protein
VCRSSGIDLITVEARVVVASIDTYLKYSEAVSHDDPGVASDGGAAGSTTDVLAENVSLRARAGRPERRDRAVVPQARRGDARNPDTLKAQPCFPPSLRPDRPRFARQVMRSPGSGLLEFLLGSADMQASARHALDWLAEHMRVRQGLVAMVEPASHHLIAVAEHGIPAHDISDFSVNLSDDDHPLRGGAGAAAPVYFRAARSAARSILPSTP